jgi:hypothetical protein
MKKSVFVFAALLAAVCLFAINIADAQWRSETHDVYNAPSGLDVTIDGNLDEWGGVMESVTGTDGSTFCGVEFEGRESEVKVWEDWGGGTWSGADDQTVCFMIAWNPDAAYLALSVTDDEHQNSGAAWNGDAAQLAFEPTGKRTGGLALFLYNVALDNNAEKLILHNERTNGQPGLEAERDFAISRDEAAKKTNYEFKFTPANFGLDIELSEGIEIGLGICVNDGDKAAGQGGQKGWSGWYPHSIVHGKHSEKMGLVVLSSTAVTAVEPADKLTTTWGNLKSEK